MHGLQTNSNCEPAWLLRPLSLSLLAPQMGSDRTHLTETRGLQAQSRIKALTSSILGEAPCLACGLPGSSRDGGWALTSSQEDLNAVMRALPGTPPKPEPPTLKAHLHK